ncbi:MAG TPA: YmdB family metallophosphoesterase [Conexibacter sp.]|nr:YmdB family metallophosphoesterase [Conexibacter sp.]
MHAPVNNSKPPAPAALARILFVGDVVGPLGLTTIETLLPSLRREHGVDFCVANGENAVDNGAGIDRASAARLFDAGVDVITTGNHAYDAPGAADLLSSGAPVIRPENLAGPRSGRAGVAVERGGIELGVVNVIGSHEGVVPDAVCDDAECAVGELVRTADLIMVDVHGSWPAEKLAVAWVLDGRVCAVVGTHTHVPTADARLLPGGTAYVSDVGMTGARDSLIGFHPQAMIRQIRQPGPALPAPVTSGEGVLMGVLITATIDGRAIAIERVTAHAPAIGALPKRLRARREPARDPQPADPPAAAVFDCDGLLVDSADCWRLAYERVLALDGRSLDDELLAGLNGASVGGAAAALRVGTEVLHAELRTTFETGPLSARPGAHALLAHLHGRLPMAVATNAPRELVALALRRVGLSAYLPIVVSADGGPGKPAPDVYLAACERLGVRPTRAVALEDSPVGAAAAQAAGLRLIYVPSADPGAVSPDLEAQRLDDDAVLAALSCTTAHRTNGAEA